MTKNSGPQRASIGTKRVLAEEASAAAVAFPSDKFSEDRNKVDGLKS
jgi:hypothetical protein